MMRGPEGLGSRPCFEGSAVLPYGVRRIKRVILRFGTFEQMELNETQPSRQLPFGTLGQVPHYVGRDGLARLPQLVKHRSGRHVALMHVSTDRVIHKQP